MEKIFEEWHVKALLTQLLGEDKVLHRFTEFTQLLNIHAEEQIASRAALAEHVPKEWEIKQIDERFNLLDIKNASNDEGVLIAMLHRSEAIQRALQYGLKKAKTLDLDTFILFQTVAKPHPNPPKDCTCTYCFCQFWIDTIAASKSTEHINLEQL